MIILSVSMPVNWCGTDSQANEKQKGKFMVSLSTQVSIMLLYTLNVMNIFL